MQLKCNMGNKKYFYITLIFSLFSSLNIQALNLKLKIVSGKKDSVIVGYYYGSAKNAYLIKKIALSNGVGEIKADSLPAALFFLIYDHKKYDFLAEKGESITMEYKDPDFYKTVKIKGSNVAKGFVEYVNFLSDKKEAATKDTTQANKIGKEVQEYCRKKIEETGDNILSKFLQFVQPLQLPDMAPNDRFDYVKAHFFDNANIFDPDMLHTPLVEDKLKEYLSFLIEEPDSICKDIDNLLIKSYKDNSLFRFMLVTTLQHYLQSKQVISENIWVHIADKWYIPFASWSDLAEMERLKYQVKARKPNLIGCLAPDFDMTVLSKEDMLKAKSDTAALNNVYQGFDSKFSSQQSNDYTLLIFFEADCSHCKEQMPKFWDVYNKLKSTGLRTIAIHNNNTKEGKVMMCNYVNEHQYYDTNWVNAWSPYSNKYRELYNIESTPTVYLIHQGKIVLKNIDSKTLEEYLRMQHKVLQHN